MRTLIVMGNGFDLDLGWKTSFGDFFQAKRDSFLQYDRLSYIQQIIDGGCWYNLEGYLRQCVLEVELSDVIFLNDFWKICSNFMLGYFAQSLPNFKTNHNSCAYHLMQALSNSIIYTFNYTNPFVKENITEPEIHFVHGKLDGATNGAQMKLGVDTEVLQANDLAKDNLLKPLIKSDANTEKEGLLYQLKKSDKIIIYGHSLSITDSDYFKLFFEYVTSNRFTSKSIYFVVYDSRGLQLVKNNMNEYGISFDELQLSQNEINIVYTSKGPKDSAFRHMLKIV
jgi:hypothetical protein